jgi:hypothetical protein
MLKFEVSGAVSSAFGLISVETLGSDAVLTLHQVLGQTAIDLAETQRKQNEKAVTPAQIVIDEMMWLLKLLLRKAPDNMIKSAAIEIVQRAVALKHDMLTERTFFKFIWYDAGSEVDASQMGIRNPRFRRFICVFPGIKCERSVWGKEEELVLLEAVVEALDKK